MTGNTRVFLLVTTNVVVVGLLVLLPWLSFDAVDRKLAEELVDFQLLMPAAFFACSAEAAAACFSLSSFRYREGTGGNTAFAALASVSTSARKCFSISEYLYCPLR
jgi:hypothetical protein